MKRKQARGKIIKAFDGLPARVVIASTLEGRKELINEDLEILKSEIEMFKPYIGMVKLGMETITRLGPLAVMQAKELGFGVFYDMKFKDIPKTVEAAVYQATCEQPEIINIHVDTYSMMVSAVKGMEKALSDFPGIPKPLLIAVTVLTSASEEEMNNQLGISGTIEDRVLAAAIFAHKSRLDGVVCSPLEKSILRRSDKLPDSFKLITPGIRPEWAIADGQTRFTTPTDAIKNTNEERGVDYIVVGSPVKTLEGAKKVLEEIEAIEY